MNKKQQAPTGARTPARAGVEGGLRTNYTMVAGQRQWRISDLLRLGADNATPCRDLARVLNWEPRAVTRAIEAERRAGTPIAANGRGYFIPATDFELDEYLRRLHHREAEVRKTREAVALTRQQRMNLGGDV